MCIYLILYYVFDYLVVDGLTVGIANIMVVFSDMRCAVDGPLCNLLQHFITSSVYSTLMAIVYCVHVL